MTYVIAGLCGSLDDLNSIEKNAAIGEKDTVYILGGVIGGELSLLTELSMRPNFYPVSDREVLDALRMLGGFTKLLSGGGTPDPGFVAEMKAWASRGGAATLEAFREMDDDMRGLLITSGNFRFSKRRPLRVMIICCFLRELRVIRAAKTFMNLIRRRLREKALI